MKEQQGLGMFGLHNLAWHPDLVEVACNTHTLDKQNLAGEFMVGLNDICLQLKYTEQRHLQCNNWVSNSEVGSTEIALLLDG